MTAVGELITGAHFDPAVVEALMRSVTTLQSVT